VVPHPLFPLAPQFMTTRSLEGAADVSFPSPSTPVVQQDPTFQPEQPGQYSAGTDSMRSTPYAAAEQPRCPLQEGHQKSCDIRARARVTGCGRSKGAERQAVHLTREAASLGCSPWSHPAVSTSRSYVSHRPSSARGAESSRSRSRTRSKRSSCSAPAGGGPPRPPGLGDPIDGLSLAARRKGSRRRGPCGCIGKATARSPAG